jgi:hypothetical protein
MSLLVMRDRAEVQQRVGGAGRATSSPALRLLGASGGHRRWSACLDGSGASPALSGRVLGRIRVPSAGRLLDTDRDDV